MSKNANTIKSNLKATPINNNEALKYEKAEKLG